MDIEKISNSTCYIFLGKNEAGKSNILKAVSLLNDEIKVNYEMDCNKKAKKTKEPIVVGYELDIDQFPFHEMNFFEFDIHFPKKIKNVIKINRILREVTIDSNNNRLDSLWIWIDTNPIFSDYVYEQHKKEFIETKLIYLGEEKLTKSNINQLISENYEIIDKAKIETILEEQMFSVINEIIPKVVVWRHSNEFLINDPINLETFSNDQSISVPLKNIFNITGIEEIEDRIDLISESTEERIELEEELSSSITGYINKIWPEHAINIIIDIENMFCKVLIEDKDDKKPKYKMEQRSDGFKKFISILLSLSIENNIETIQNNLILLDEPEVHLHPSGIRYLRDELLSISKNNTVLISSHSTYMVDKMNLNRHFKVEKIQSETTIKQIDKNNPYEEEVIYEALGTSVYEHIQPNMLVFEGKTDKDVFDAFTYKFRMDFKPVKVGTISADGVEKIPQYTKFIDGKFVKGFIITDSDNAGIRIKESIINNNNKSFNSKNTFEINSILNTKKQATLEDLFPKSIIKEVIKNKYEIDIELNDEPVIKQLEKKSKESKGKINVKEFKGVLVNYIINDISKLNKIESTNKYSLYHDFALNLNDKLKN